MALAREHGYPLHEARSMIWHGWVLACREQGHDGLAQIRRGLEIAEGSGEFANRPYYLALLAEVYGMTEQIEAGLTELKQALTLVGNGGSHWYEAELHRLEGEFQLQLSPDHQSVSETCFQKALEVARRQQAKSLELRAATSLARLWQSQGKRQDAHELLKPVYEWFNEGFDTADLKDAKALLNELG